jgi:hypothetical protein
MSIVNVNRIQPVGSGQTVTINAENISAGSATVINSSGVQVGAGKSVRIYGSTSGYADLIAPAVAGDQQILLPGTAGTLDRLNRAGNILQVVNFQTGVLATGTTTIPLDDTIPQNTEGNEYMTLAITPTNASNKLLITVTAFLSHSGSGSWMIGALFQDSTANALASFTDFQQTATGANCVVFSHYMTAGTTSSTTFKFRAGGQQAGTTTFNGQAAGRLFGGSATSSITITEIAA